MTVYLPATSYSLLYMLSFPKGKVIPWMETISNCTGNRILQLPMHDTARHICILIVPHIVIVAGETTAEEKIK